MLDIMRLILSFIFNVDKIVKLPQKFKLFYIKHKQKTYLEPAYKYVEELLCSQMNRNIQGDLPAPINSKYTWQLINSMAWLIFNAEIGNSSAVQILNSIKNYITNNIYYSEKDYLNDWHNPLLTSFDNDFELIKIWEYKDIEYYQIPILTKKKELYYWFKQKIKNCKNTNWRWCLIITLLGIIVYKLFL